MTNADRLMSCSSESSGQGCKRRQWSDTIVQRAHYRFSFACLTDSRPYGSGRDNLPDITLTQWVASGNKSPCRPLVHSLFGLSFATRPAECAS